MGSSTNKRDVGLILILFLIVVALWGIFMTSDDDPVLGNFTETKYEADRVLAVSDGENGCSDYRFMPPGTFPNIALASVQGSGNTWVRWLLQSSTGFAAASVYKEGRNKGFRIEKCNPCNGTALVVKNHREIDEPIDGAIILIRNPYNAIIAEFNRRMSSKDHTGFAPLRLFTSSTWNKFIAGPRKDWFTRLLEIYTNEGKPIHIVFYEDLKRDVEKELREILKFLKVPINEKRLACTLINTDGTAHRKSNLGETLDPFTTEQRRVIDDIIKRIDTLLRNNGLPAVPEEYWTYPGPFHR